MEKPKRPKGHPAKWYLRKDLFKRVPKVIHIECSNAVDNIVKEWESNNPKTI